MKLPLTWPNSSDSSRVSGMPAQLMGTNGSRVRGLPGVNGPRDQFLARAAFAGDQHLRVGAGDALDLLHQLAKLGDWRRSVVRSGVSYESCRKVAAETSVLSGGEPPAASRRTTRSSAGEPGPSGGTANAERRARLPPTWAAARRCRTLHSLDATRRLPIDESLAAAAST